jgi:hypothetical protein
VDISGKHCSLKDITITSIYRNSTLITLADAFGAAARQHVENLVVEFHASGDVFERFCFT